jgi:hypothetical protein
VSPVWLEPVCTPLAKMAGAAKLLRPLARPGGSGEAGRRSSGYGTDFYGIQNLNSGIIEDLLIGKH